MIPKKNIKDLQLSDEQLQIYMRLEHKEKALKTALKNCGVHSKAIDGIVNNADLNKLPDNVDILQEQIKETWKDFIVGGNKNG